MPLPVCVIWGILVVIVRRKSTNVTLTLVITMERVRYGQLHYFRLFLLNICLLLLPIAILYSYIVLQ